MAKRARARTNREKAVRGDALLRGAGGGPKRSKAAQRRAKQVMEDRDDPHIINRAAMAPEAKRPGPASDKVPVNDRLEGVIRDPVRYQGGLASYVRDVGVHDVDYDPQVRKVVLVTEDNKRVVALAADINTSVVPPVVETRRANRAPDKTFPVGHPGNIVPGAGR